MSARRVEKLEDVEGTKLVIWVITTGTKDHGERFVVRRHATLCSGGDLDGAHLVETACTVHDTLDEARHSLPTDLCRVSPCMGDDDVIVETWL